MEQTLIYNMQDFRNGLFVHLGLFWSYGIPGLLRSTQPYQVICCVYIIPLSLMFSNGFDNLLIKVLFIWIIYTRVSHFFFPTLMKLLYKFYMKCVKSVTEEMILHLTKL